MTGPTNAPIRSNRVSDIFISSTDVAEFHITDESWSAYENTGTRPAFENAVTILVDAMLSKPSDEQLQQKALVSLKRMAQEQDKRPALGQSGCVQTAVTAMRMFPNNIELICKGCQFLANVSLNCEENQHRVRECRGIELIMALMKRHGNVESVQSSALLVLRNLTQESPQVQREAIKNGSLEAIQQTLSHFEPNADLQVHGIAAIGNLACYNLETQKRIRECGCIDVVIKAMKNHPLHLSLLRNAAFTLKHICFQNETNQRSVAKLGGIEILTELLRGYSENVSLIVDVCSTIRYMCFAEQVRACLGQNGCLILMMESLSVVCKNGTKEGVDQILKALSNATFDPQDNKKVVAKCGGVDIVMSVLNAFQGDPDIVGGCLRVFRNIIDKGGEIYQLLCNAHVFSIAMECAARFPSNDEITEHLFALILYATAYEFEEDTIGITMEDARSVVANQLEALPESVAVQQLGRELSSHLEYLEELSLSKVSKKSKKKRSILHKLSLRGA